MARRRIEVKMVNYGLYGEWDRSSRELPDFRRFTETVPVRTGTEFGYILEIRGAKRCRLFFEMIHPPGIHDPQGKLLPDVFTGELTVPQNEYRFFLGDTFWEPLPEKCGRWTLITYIDGDKVAEKTFEMIPEEKDV